MVRLQVPSKTLETQVMMQNDKCLFSDESISDTIESSRNTMMRQPHGLQRSYKYRSLLPEDENLQCFSTPFTLAPAHRRHCLPLMMNWFGMNPLSNKSHNTFLHPFESCYFCNFNGSSPQISLNYQPLTCLATRHRFYTVAFFFLDCEPNL